MEETVKEFFRASIERKLDDFDFDSAFEQFSGAIRQKLAEHGLLSFDEFIESESDYGFYSKDDLTGFAVHTGYIVISTDELLEVLQKYRYERFKAEFSRYGSFQSLLSLYERIQKQYSLSTSEKAILFDECIHAQHETGDIFDDLDIEGIKEEIDREYETHK